MPPVLLGAARRSAPPDRARRPAVGRGPRPGAARRPTTLTSAAAPGSPLAPVTELMPARWKTAVGRSDVESSADVFDAAHVAEHPLHGSLLVGGQQRRRRRRINGGEAGDVVAGVEQGTNEPLADEPGRASHERAHVSPPSGSGRARGYAPARRCRVEVCLHHRGHQILRKLTVGAQPSCSCALVGSATRTSTSAGRMNRSSLHDVLLGSRGPPRRTRSRRAAGPTRSGRSRPRSPPAYRGCSIRHIAST